MENFPLFCLCMVAAGYLDTAVHECGHWAAGRLVGLAVREVRVGGGRELASFAVGSAVVSLGSVPWSGYVAPYAQFRVPLWRHIVMMAGGSAASLVLLAAAAALLQSCPDCGEPSRTLLFATLINAMWGSGQVLPLLPWARGRRRDYHLIRDAVRARGRLSPSEEWAESRYAALVVGRYPPAGPADASRLAPAVLHALTAGPPGAAPEEGSVEGRRAAFASFERRLLRRRSLSTPERAALLDGLATAALLGEVQAPPGDLDAWTAELIALAPDLPTARGTRGSALVLLGRPGGRALLECDFDDASPAFDRVVRRVFLARALLDEGDRDGAARVLAEAGPLDSGTGAAFPVLAELRAALAAASAPAPR